MALCSIGSHIFMFLQYLLFFFFQNVGSKFGSKLLLKTTFLSHFHSNILCKR